jgi:hypothetical protein
VTANAWLVRGGCAAAMSAVLAFAITPRTPADAGSTSPSKVLSVLPLPPGATHLERPNDPLSWRDWLPLVPCLRAPTTDDGLRRIIVFIKLPADAQLELSGPRELRLPIGTRAARVEYQADTPDLDAAPNAAFHVLDVRASTLTQEGAQYTIMRPMLGVPKLFGFEWDPKRADTRAAAGALMRSGLLEGPSDDAAAVRFQSIHDCAGCHAPNRAVSAIGRVHRATDAQGFFGLRSVFDDESPFETYRPRNANTGDPYISVQAAPEGSPAGAASFGRLRVREGRAAGDRHVAQVCETRAALSRVFSHEAQKAFAKELGDCSAL